MRYGFYFRFYKKLHNDALCCIMANIAYAFFCFAFLIKKHRRKRYNVNLSFEKARSLVESLHPRYGIEPSYVNKPINKKIDLSIVVPVYNYVHVLEKNIDSIINQKTKYNYDIILVDDGSTDGSAELIKKYEENTNVKVVHQENSGIGVARNVGINNSDGKYLMFVDCDDVVHQDIVETLLDEAYSKDYDMVMCAHNLSKEKNGINYESIPNIYSKNNLMRYKNGDEIMNLAGLPWGKVYKRTLWNNVRFFPKYWYEDTIIQFLIFMQCETYSYVPKIEYEYKWYENNFSHVQGNAVNIKSIDIYWLMVEILEQYRKLKLPEDAKFYTLVLRHLSLYYYCTLKELDNEVIEALFVLAKEIYEEIKPKNKIKLPYMLRQVEKAFDNNDIELWKLASIYQ